MVLVISCVARGLIHSGLSDQELACLMRSIRRVGGVIERVYGGDALTVACQVRVFYPIQYLAKNLTVF